MTLRLRRRPQTGAVGGRQERFTLRNVHLYLICLITLVVSIFAAVDLVQSTVGLLYPDPGHYGFYEPLGTGTT